jgi:hypothetical protein
MSNGAKETAGDAVIVSARRLLIRTAELPDSRASCWPCWVVPACAACLGGRQRKSRDRAGTWPAPARVRGAGQ